MFVGFRAFLVPALIVGLLGGCSPSRSADEHYRSARVQGDEEKINLEAVHQAFFETSGKSFSEWMPNFEKRVNEIYQGDEVVSIDADKKDGMVRVAGYVDKDGQDGLGSGDEKLFELQQTAPADRDGFRYTMTGQGGQPYYNGYPPPAYHRGILDNPFVQMFVLSQLLRPNFSYYTPPTRHTTIRSYRGSYRQSPRYRTQTAQNKGFFNKLFTKKSDRVRSSKGFGSGWTSAGGSGQKKRSWFGSSGGNDSRWTGRRSGSSWGSSSRRSSSWGSGRSSSWGGRRSGGFGGGRSWGGRRR